jgi:hypothetical protein
LTSVSSGAERPIPIPVFYTSAFISTSLFSAFAALFVPGAGELPVAKGRVLGVN